MVFPIPHRKSAGIVSSFSVTLCDLAGQILCSVNSIKPDFSPFTLIRGEWYRMSVTFLQCVKTIDVDDVRTWCRTLDLFHSSVCAFVHMGIVMLEQVWFEWREILQHPGHFGLVVYLKMYYIRKIINITAGRGFVADIFSFIDIFLIHVNNYATIICWFWLCSVNEHLECISVSYCKGRRESL